MSNLPWTAWEQGSYTCPNCGDEAVLRHTIVSEVIPSDDIRTCDFLGCVYLHKNHRLCVEKFVEIKRLSSPEYRTLREAVH